MTSEQRKAMIERDTTRATDVLAEVLRDGPLRLKDIRRLARERHDFYCAEWIWRKARKSLGVGVVEVVEDGVHSSRWALPDAAETSRRPTQADAAVRFLARFLADGPTRPKDLRAEAQRQGWRLDEQAWKKARRQLGVETIRAGRDFYWQLPGADLDDELAELLDTPAARFEVYYQQRARLLAATRPGDQLRLVPGEATP